ncbi:MAG: hypothetical protein K0R09_2108 [Clostridiales bacterium]|jgi:hypothetical protein|nr:hypothetical protein [Clostridiales bacterium]
MEFYRASEDELEFIKYERSFIHNTALVASEEKKVIGILEYDIKNIEEAEIIYFNMVQACDSDILIKGFIDEIAYWNPNLKRITYKKENNFIEEDALIKAGFLKNGPWSINMNNPVEAFRIDIEKITPEQLTVDKEKLNRVNSWIEKPEDVVICCVRIRNKVVSIDGHSRLVTAYNKGFRYVYAYIEADNDNIEFYKTCMDWCEEQGIYTIKDLSSRVVTPEEHERLWISRCQGYLKENQKQ